MNLEIKKDPAIALLYVVMIAALTLLLYKGIVRWDQVEYLALGVLVPSFVGRKTETKSRQPPAPSQDQEQEKKE